MESGDCSENCEFGEDSPKVGENSNYYGKRLKRGPLESGDFDENEEIWRRFSKGCTNLNEMVKSGL